MPVIEVHAEALLWYILASDEATKATFGYWGTACVLSPFPLLPLRSVVFMIIIAVGIVVPGSILWLV